MFYNWNDILIVGDSFCGNRDWEEDWPQQVCLKLSNETYSSSRLPRGWGYGGSSWWSVRKTLLEELNLHPVKVIIICHTEPFRIPSDSGFGFNLRSVLETGKVAGPPGISPPSSDQLKSAKKYYKNLFSEKFHLWTNAQWFKELDEILIKHSVEKVIHLYCFSGEYTDNIFQKGVTLKIPLIEYNVIKTPKAFNRNHFEIDQNLKIASELYNIIKNYPGDGFELNNRLLDLKVEHTND